MPGIPFHNNLDMNSNQLLNVLAQVLANDPGTPSEAQFWYNSTDKRLKLRTDAATLSLAALGDLQDFVLSQFAAGVVLTDINISHADDSTIASAKSIKTYVDNAVGAASSGMSIQGGIDCSTNPNFPAANQGYVYRVTVAGKIGGASGEDVTVGDTIICATTTTGGDYATDGANWIILQDNIGQATESLAGYVQLASTIEAESKTATDKAVTPAGLANYMLRKTFNIGDGSLKAFPLSHNLGTRDVHVQIFQASGDYLKIEATVQTTSTSVVTVTFGAHTPTTNEFRAVITG